MGQKSSTIHFPPKFRGLFESWRYKIFHGGRGSAKSWCCARALLLLGLKKRLRVLCARETQVSIADSVHKLLSEQIITMGLEPWYTVQKTAIFSTTGTEFMFKGIKHNAQSIKSTEGIDIAWLEEAQLVSEESWNILVPTVRKENSEIWVTFNPNEETDPTYQRFVVRTPPNSLVMQVNWQDNPYFPQVLRDEMEYLRAVDYDAYLHIWEGQTRRISDAVIFKGKVSVQSFETPPMDVFYLGADWGFAKDPTVLIRFFIYEGKLWIDHEAYGIGVDLDDTPALFDKVPESRKWMIEADSARPETISHLRRKGFKIRGAAKWSGSVEDGIAFLRSFPEIVIHERCKHMIDEAKLYKYKVDPLTGEPLPAIEDRHNHCWDAVRYACGPIMKHTAKVKLRSGGKRLAPAVGRF